MNVKELIAAAKATVVDDKKAAVLRNRLKEAEEQFEAESRAKAINKDFLSRTYSL